MVARVALAVVAICACGGRPADGPPATRAFYYWRTTFHLAAAEQRALAELHVARLYVRVFDVDWDGAAGAPIIVGKIDGDRVPAGLDVVPVVFLRDEVFRHPTPGLARTIRDELDRRVRALGAPPSRELQLDCDWTERTRDAYFAFVRELGALVAVPLSATIRLHQIKYRERTGVPPVGRGMLMFYNMGRFSADPDARAIFDADAAARYLARVADYPLALDVALPIWSWVVHVRDDVVVGLLQSVDPDELAASPYLARAAPDRYVATQTAVFRGALLRAGDVLKIEVTGPAETRAAAAMIAGRLAAVPVSQPRALSLFDLSERNLHRHGVDDLEQVFRAVR